MNIIPKKKKKYYKNNPENDLEEEYKDNENWFQEVLKREKKIKGEKEIIEDIKVEKKEENKSKKRKKKIDNRKINDDN